MRVPPRSTFLDLVADATMNSHPLFTRFEVTPRRRESLRPADRDRPCLLRGFPIKALSREPHCVVSGGGIRMRQNCAIADHSIAEIPMIGQGGSSIFRHDAGELNLFP